MARGTVYNGDIVTDEKLKNVNSDNMNLLDEFVEYLHSVDRATLTIKNYISDINIAFCWNLDKNKDKFFIVWSKRDFMKFQNYMLSEMKLGSGRVRRLRSALSSMSNFIENIMDDEYPQFRNVVNKIQAPSNKAVREKTIFEEDDLQKLLDICIEKGAYQKACLLCAAAFSGSRKQELLRLKVEYFKDENIILNGKLYQTPKIISKGRGKGGKLIHKYFLVEKMKPYLELWLNEREKLNINSEWLFIIKDNKTNDWKQMQVSTADSYALTFSKWINVDFYWHSLRHYFTTYLSQVMKLPDDVIQTLNSWASVSMVSTYKDVTEEEQLAKFFK